jgi:hypothetical protein
VIRIDRSDLVAKIIAASKSGSVLITGSPGAGKSWLCDQALQVLEAKGENLVLAITAEEHSAKSLDELRTSLGLNSDVVSFLNSLPGNPVLLIDGLDSLRGDPSQNTFRELIRQTFLQVPRCAVIASIRAFDLRKSPEFQRLFFSHAVDSRNAVLEIGVPELSDEELAGVAAKDESIRPLITQASPQLKQLLRNPFNLTLAFSLIRGGVQAADLSLFDSEVQLLNKYWEWRVTGLDDSYERLEVLRPLLERMVVEQSLSVGIGGMYHPGLGKTLVSLQSDEILKESATGRLAFEHNILFDYALARVLLDDQNLINFIETDTNRTIFYRPSLAYFFYYLWLADRELFWGLSLSLIGSRTLPERAGIIPVVTMYLATRDVEDLDRVLGMSSEIEITAVTGVLRALQTFGGIQGTSRSVWITVLVKIGSNFKMEFVNEFAAILNAADEGRTETEAAPLLDLAIKFLNWIWEQCRKSTTVEKARALAEFASARLFHVIVSNYRVRADAVRNVVRVILSRYSDERSSASEALRLANDMAAVIAVDPETAIAIYRQTYGHHETSRDETRIGGGAVMSFTSNRAQDFSGAQYALQAKFKGFMHADPLNAVRAAIQSVNAQVGREHGPTEARRIQEFTFSYKGTRGVYRADGSELWDFGGPDLTSLNLLKTAITGSVMESEDAIPLADLIVQLTAEAEYAVAWKKLFELAVMGVDSCFEDMLPLLLIPELISAPEVTIAVGAFIGAAYSASVVSKDVEILLESAIISIPNTPVILKYENPDSIRNRLLLCIPRTNITSEEILALYDRLVDGKQVRKNEPYHSYGLSQRAYGTEDYLSDQGTNIEFGDNKRTIGVINVLENWERRFLNAVPSATDCEEVETHLREMEKLIKKDRIEKPVAATARGAICAAAKTVLRNGKLARDNSAVVQCRRIVLRGAHDEIPIPDPTNDAKFDSPAWGGGCARIEAAQGLINYRRNWGADRSVTAAINKLSRDPVPAVRFQIAIGLTALWSNKKRAPFWKTLQNMIVNESTAGVMIALIHAAGSAAGADPDAAARALVSAVKRGLPKTDRSELCRGLSQVLVGLYVARANTIANDQLLEFESSPIEFDRELVEEVYAISAYIGREGAEHELSRERSREILTRIVKAVHLAIKSLNDAPPSDTKSEQFVKLLKILDHVAIRLFHDLGIDPSGPTINSGADSPANAWLYWEIKPLLKLLATHDTDADNHFLAAHTANYLMQTFNGIVGLDPSAAVEFAAAVCKAAEKADYHFEREAVVEMTSLVQRILADHRELLKDPESASALGGMLDLFAKVGWPEAWSLTVRLDEAIR